MTPYECICRCISRVKINHSSGLKTKEEKRSYRTAFDHFWPRENRERILVVKKNIKIVIPAPLICDIVHYKSKEDYCASMGGIYRFFFWPFLQPRKNKDSPQRWPHSDLKTCTTDFMPKNKLNSLGTKKSKIPEKNHPPPVLQGSDEAWEKNSALGLMSPVKITLWHEVQNVCY